MFMKMVEGPGSILFIERKKIRSKGLVQGPGVQKTFRLSSHTPEQFNVMPRTSDLGISK